jgi:protein-S-isoprenylcysteine O-methyltransferase Ste14
VETRPRPSRLPDLGPHGEGWLLGQFILIPLAFLLSLPRVSELEPTEPASWLALLAGGAGVVIGSFVILLGVRGLGSNLTPLPRPRDGGILVESGVYARIRHPIYAGLILASFGWGLFTRGLPTIAVAALLGILLDAKARREEGWLMESYPAYEAYRRRTKRFVPGIY